jgi:quinolinate synthase
MKEDNPGVPVVCYINTSAAVKAECDVCVTSSNYLRICERLPGEKLIFVPDKFMGRHLQNSLRGKKEVVLYDGECEVHAEFTGPKIRNWKKSMSENGIDLMVLSHPECDSEVLDESDFVGSSELLMNEAIRLASIGKRNMMLITECGTADRVLAETEDTLNLMGACVMCKHMKKTQLEDILQALIDPYPEQIVEISRETLRRASKSLEKMFILAE